MTHLTLRSLDPTDRVFRFSVGMGMIFSVFLFPGSAPLGWMALLPLVGIYPCLTGVLGIVPRHEGDAYRRGRQGQFPALYDVAHPA